MSVDTLAHIVATGTSGDLAIFNKIINGNLGIASQVEYQLEQGKHFYAYSLNSTGSTGGSTTIRTYWFEATSTALEYYTTFDVEVDTAVKVQIYEGVELGATGTAGGALTTFNYDRASTETDNAVFYSSANISSSSLAVGTEIFGFVTGTVGRQSNKNNLFKLTPGTTYYIQFTPLAATLTMALKIDWWEV